jgi:hypothetical protein
MNPDKERSRLEHSYRRLLAFYPARYRRAECDVRCAMSV